MWPLFLFFTLLTPPVMAQDASPAVETTAPITQTKVPPTPTPRLFDQYQKDYLFQYGLYQDAYLKYIDKKKVYTKYGTITTQKEKFSAAIEAINARNKTFKAYLLALRTLMDDYELTDPTQTEKNQINLKKWEDWFNEQLTVVSVINNDGDLKKWTDDFKQKYTTVQQVMYTALVQHEINLRNQTLSKLQAIAADIRNNPQIRPESQQWVSDLTVKSDLADERLINAINLTKRNQNQNKFSNFYPDARNEMTRANNYLREITADLRLIVTRFYQP